MAVTQTSFANMNNQLNLSNTSNNLSTFGPQRNSVDDADNSNVVFG